ncbi:MAG TPA: hypothetical protein VGZ01_01780, partial [Trinickia sp.]|nr:hypothetical protein [Trinickia sp.]
MFVERACLAVCLCAVDAVLAVLFGDRALAGGSATVGPLLASAGCSSSRVACALAGAGSAAVGGAV